MPHLKNRNGLTGALHNPFKPSNEPFITRGMAADWLSGTISNPCLSQGAFCAVLSMHAGLHLWLCWARPPLGGCGEGSFDCIFPPSPRL